MEMELRSLLWPEASWPRIVIVILIVLLGLYGLSRAFVHWRRLHDELKNIHKAESKLDEWDKTSSDGQRSDDNHDVDASVGNPSLRLTLRELDSRLGELESSVSVGTHIRKRIAAIRRLRDRQVKLNLETLQQITVAAERTFMGAETARNVAGWAMMLGVFGTFIGLSQMIQEIRIQVPTVPGDFDTMVASARGVNGVFQGMGTAFSTSVAGIFVGITCAVAAFLVQREQAVMFHRLEEVTVGKLLPATVSALDDDSILERISGQMERAFAHLDSVTDSNRRSLEEFSAAQDALRAIVTDVRQILANEARQDVRLAIDRIIQTNELVARMIASLPLIAESIEGTNRTLSEGLSRLDETVRAGPVITDQPTHRFFAVSPRAFTLLAVVGVLWALLATFGLL